MPAIPLNRDNAWNNWKQGRIAATNVQLWADAPGSAPILTTLAVKKGYNAIRLWLNWGIVAGASNYTLRSGDWQHIGWWGWSSTAPTLATSADPTPLTIANIKARVIDILDKCQALGMGVILTGDFFKDIDDTKRLWVDNGTTCTDPYISSSYFSLSGTTAAGLQGDLGLFWQKTVAAFGYHQALIGIDFLNEPEPPANLPWANHPWRNLAQYLVGTSRTTDTSVASGVAANKRIAYIVEAAGVAGFNPFVNPSNASDTSLMIRDYDYTGNPNASASTDRIIYSPHMYDPDQFTGQGVYGWDYVALGSGYPYGTVREFGKDSSGNDQVRARLFKTSTDMDSTDSQFAPVKTLKNLGAPIFVGEFSAVQPLLDQVYPPTASRTEVVTTQAKAVSGSTPPAVIAVRQITSITQDNTNSRFVFNLENLDGGFEPGAPLSTSLPSPWSYDETTKVMLNGTTPVAANVWPVSFFTNSNLKATIHLVNPSTGKLFLLIASTPITLVGGQLWFSVPFSALPTSSWPSSTVPLPVTRTGSAAPYAVKAVVTLETSRSASSVNTARALWVTHALQMFKRNGFSWAWYHDDAPDGAGNFIGWRTDKPISALIAKAARGEAV